MKHVVDSIPAWLADELSDRESTEFQGHLKQCQACAAEARAQRELWVLLGDVGARTRAQVEGVSVWPEVRARILAEDSGGGWFFGNSPWIRSALATGAVACGIMLGVVMPGSRSGTPASIAVAEDEGLEISWIAESSWLAEDAAGEMAELWFNSDLADDGGGS